MQDKSASSAAINIMVEMIYKLLFFISVFLVLFYSVNKIFASEKRIIDMIIVRLIILFMIK